MTSEYISSMQTTSHEVEVGTRYGFRYVDGKMFQYEITADMEVERERKLWDPGTHLVAIKDMSTGMFKLELNTNTV